MQVETFQYIKDKGWSVTHLPNLDSENTLILVFGSPDFKDKTIPFQELKKHYPNSKIIGCSSAGEIFGPAIIDHSLSVAVIKFNKTKIKSCETTIELASNSYQAGVEISKRLDADDLAGIFILSDGLNINGSELVRGLNSLNKNHVIITGGLAGDGHAFQQTWTLYENKVTPNRIVAVGFYGNHIHIGHGSKGGWDIFGPERRITRSKENILYELDNKPALGLYKEYLGEKATGLPATGLLYPLSIRKDLNDTKQLVRTILAVDEKNQSLTFAGDVPEGYLAQLMRANFDRLIAGADAASQMTLDSFSCKESAPPLLIAISCVGRRLLLGERTDEETESTLELFPKGTQQIGFYSYGEISPYASGHCDLHNQTMTLTAICEED